MQSHTWRLVRLSLTALAAATALLLSSAAAVADGGGGHGGGGHGGHGHGGHGHHGGHRAHHGAHPGVVHLGRAGHDHHDRLHLRPHDVHLGVRHGIHHRPLAFFGFGHGLHQGGYYWDECDPYSLHYSLSRCRWLGPYGYDSYYWGGYTYGWRGSSGWGTGLAYGGATAGASVRSAQSSAPFARYAPLDPPSGAAPAADVPMRVPLLPSLTPPEALPFDRDELPNATSEDAQPADLIKEETRSRE